MRSVTATRLEAFKLLAALSCALRWRFFSFSSLAPVLLINTQHPTRKRGKKKLPHFSPFSPFVGGKGDGEHPPARGKNKTEKKNKYRQTHFLYQKLFAVFSCFETNSPTVIKGTLVRGAFLGFFFGAAWTIQFAKHVSLLRRARSHDTVQAAPTLSKVPPSTFRNLHTFPCERIARKATGSFDPMDNPTLGGARKMLQNPLLVVPIILGRGTWPVKIISIRKVLLISTYLYGDVRHYFQSLKTVSISS